MPTVTPVGSPVVIQTPLPAPTTAPIGHTFSGFVTDATNGQPLAGAHVAVSGTSLETNTDEHGFYRLTGVGSATHTLRAEARGYLPEDETVPSGTFVRVDFRLQPVGAATLRFHDLIGRVSDRNTVLPIAGVTIRMRSTNNVLHTAVDESVQTDAQGNYELRRLPEGQWTFDATKTGYKPYTENFFLGSKQAKDVLLKGEPATLKGLVTGNRVGQIVPIEGALVTLTAVDAAGNGLYGPIKVVTAADGRYAAADLPPLTYRMVVFSAGYVLDRGQITLAPNQQASRDVRLQLRAARVDLVLTTPTYGGLPLAGFEVQLQGLDDSPSKGIDLHAQADAQGRVSFVDLVPGSYELSTPHPFFNAGADGGQFESVRMTLRLGLDEVRSVRASLPVLSGAISGWVRGGTHLPEARKARAARRDVIDGTHDSFPYIPAPLAGTTIDVVDARFGSHAITLPQTQFTSDDFGNYGMTLPPGTYELEFSKADYVTRTETLSIRSSGAEKNVHMKSARTAAVGRIDGLAVRDLTNQRNEYFLLEDADVVLERQGVRYPVRTNDRGLFVVEDLPLDVTNGQVQPTAYTLTVTHPLYGPLNGTLTLTHAEGIHAFVRRLDDLQAFGTLGIQLSWEDDQGNSFPSSGALDRLKSLDTHQGYPPIGNVPIPGSITLQARPGTYFARICPSPGGGTSVCYDYDWTSVHGTTVQAALHLKCDPNATGAASCRLLQGPGFRWEGTITLGGNVYNRETGEPLDAAKVTLNLGVDTMYCRTSCWRARVPLAGTATTNAKGRYSVTVQVPASDGSGELAEWSWNGTNRKIHYEKVGYVAVTNTGSNATYKGFRELFNAHLQPSGILSGLVLSNDAERAPVTGLDPSLGARLTVVDGPADIRVTPRGVVTQTDLFTTPSQFELTTSPGQVEVHVENRHHYPYSGPVTVLPPSGGNPVTTEYTFVLERIPEPEIDGFEILSQADNQPLRGYILKGFPFNETRVRWKVRVDRNGIRRLRQGFTDPVGSVRLQVEVVDACAGVPTPLSALEFVGERISGDPHGVSEWGGTLEAADLPCGRLRWVASAVTARMRTDETVTWDLRPATPRFPLSLLTLFSYPSTQIPQALSGKSALEISPWGIGLEVSALKVKRPSAGSAYLDYEIEELTLTTKAAAPTQSGFVRMLGQKELGVRGLEGKIEDVKLSGSSGLLDFTAQCGLLLKDAEGDAGDATKWLQGRMLTPVRVNATSTSLLLRYGQSGANLWVLETPVVPTGTSVAQEFKEIIGAEYESMYDIAVPTIWIPRPIEWALRKTGIAKLDLILGHKWEPAMEWDLDTPAVVPLAQGFQRLVTGNVDVKLKFTGTVGLKLDLGSGTCSIAGGFRPVGEFTWSRGSMASGNSFLYLDEAALKGRLWAQIKFGELWSLTHNFPTYEFYTWKFGTNSIATTADGTETAEWVARNWIGAGYARHVWQPGSTSGRLQEDGYPRPVPVLAASTGGTPIALMVHDDANGAWPNSLGFRLSRRDAAGNWSAPAPVDLGRAHALLEGEVAFDGSREVVAVSAIPGALTVPGRFVADMAGAEILVSVRDPATSTWSTPSRLTNNDVPDVDPILVPDGQGKLLLVWTRHRDGNVLTVDDLVVMAAVWNGSTWSTPAEITPGGIANGAIAVAARNGRAVVAFTERAVPESRIHAVTFDGASWSAPRLVGSTSVLPHFAAAGWTASGDARVVWVEGSDARPEKDIRTAVVGSAIGAPETIARALDVSDVRVSRDSQGRAIVVWSTDRDTQPSGIYAAARSGSGWSAIHRLLEEPGGFASIDVVPGSAPGVVVVLYAKRDGDRADIGVQSARVP